FLVAALGGVDDCFLPIRLGPLLEASDNLSSAPANGHELNAALVDARHFGVVDQLGIEVKPLGISAGNSVPELDETHELAVLIGPCQVGVGIAQTAAFLLQGKERQHAWPGNPPARQVMPIQARRVAAI